ncbi:MAG: PilZ domain-containing protein [Nitrospirota bacterium]
MEEKRKHKRIMVLGMDIHGKMLYATDVNLLTISLGGASISLHKKLNIGSEYTLKVEYKDKVFSLKGVVVWEKLVDSEKDEKGETIPIYEVGLEFKDVLAEKGDELIDFIEAITVIETIKPRLRGTRVKIIKPVSSSIPDYYTSYNVINLSLGGMLIETDHAMKVDSKFQMEVIFPENKGLVECRGRVAFCSEIANKIPKSYNTGIEFVEMSKEGRSRLKEFIDSLEKSINNKSSK